MSTHRGFFGWIGGKNRLSKTIVQRIEATPHTCYVEGFAGAAHVFFRRPPAESEVLNDLNRDIVTLYRVLQWHLDEFVRYFRWALVSRDEFDRLNRTEPDTLTDIQRAARFFYLQKCAFGGRPTSRTLGTSTQKPPRLNLLRIEEDLSAAHLRLARVLIENLPWQECLRRYDRPHTLFYLDPPYYGCEDYYGKGLFGREQFAELAEALARIEGAFVLSLNDCPEVRELFGAFHLQPLQVRYSVSHQIEGRKKFGELLIANRPPPP